MPLDAHGGPRPTAGTTSDARRPAVPEPGAAVPGLPFEGRSTTSRAYREAPTAPYLLRMAAGWTWRVLVVALGVYLLLLLAVRLRVALGAFIGALLLAALVMPVHQLLRRARLPAALAALVTVLLLMGVVGGGAALLGTGIADQFDDLVAQVSAGINRVTDLARDLGISPEQVERLRGQAQDALSSSSGRLLSGAVTATTVAAEVLSGLALGLFLLFFFLKDGPVLWAWVVRLFAPRVRGQADQAGQRAWVALTGYMRGIVVIALADALLVALALEVLDVPLVLPLAVITFLGAFVPIVGAFVSGGAALLVALISSGDDLLTPLLVVVAYVVVQQVEGNLLHPVVMRRAVALHPLVTVVAVTAGATLAGIAGAIVSVPLVALINTVVLYLSAQGALVRRTLGDIEGRGVTAEPAYPVLALLTPDHPLSTTAPVGGAPEQGRSRPA